MFPLDVPPCVEGCVWCIRCQTVVECNVFSQVWLHDCVKRFGLSTVLHSDLIRHYQQFKGLVRVLLLTWMGGS